MTTKTNGKPQRSPDDVERLVYDGKVYDCMDKFMEDFIRADIRMLEFEALAYLKAGYSSDDLTIVRYDNGHTRVVLKDGVPL